MRKEDIVLILPPHRWKEHRYSLGLLYVSSYLRQQEFDNIIIERGLFKNEYQKHNKDLAKKLIIEKVKELKPKIVGFTATVQEFDEVIEINKELKKQLNFVSVIGGPQATAMPNDFLDNGFDVAVVGEGEETAFELVKSVFNQQSFKNLLGIAYKNEQRKVIKNSTRPYINISNIPMPTYGKIGMESYTAMWDGIVRGVPLRSALIMTSRGCPYHCSFCDCNKVFGRNVRYRNLDNIRQEIKFLKEKYVIEGVWLADDTFTLNKEHILGVGKIMRQFDLIWACQARVNLINEDLIRQMKQDGCVQFDFGVESGSPRVLAEIMNKQINLNQIRQAFKLCRKHGMRTLANFMMGMPTETRAEMEQTFALAKEIKADFYVFSIFTPLPGASLFDKYFADEITSQDYKELGFFMGVEKYNKSEVRNLKELHNKWRKALAWEMKKRRIFHPGLLLKIFFKLGNKKERAKFLLNKVKNLLKM